MRFAKERSRREREAKFPLRLSLLSYQMHILGCLSFPVGLKFPDLVSRMGSVKSDLVQSWFDLKKLH